MEPVRVQDVVSSVAVPTALLSVPVSRGVVRTVLPGRVSRTLVFTLGFTVFAILFYLCRIFIVGMSTDRVTRT